MTNTTFKSLHPAEQNNQAVELRKRLQDAYGVLDCRRALVVKDGDVEAAARYLTDGGWISGKLITWRHAELVATTEKLTQELNVSAQEVLTVLKHCAGNEELARRKLSQRPLWD